MARRTRPYIYLALATIFFLSFAAAYWGKQDPNQGQYVEKKPEKKPLLTTEPWIQTTVGGQETVLIEQTYSLCGHTITEEVTIPEAAKEVKDGLSTLYPAKEGWVIETTPEGKGILRHTTAGLCPDDSLKRHLGAYGDRVGVFVGPPGLNGGVDKVTQIPIQSLPPVLQKSVIEGTCDLTSEEELLQVMDSYDEDVN